MVVHIPPFVNASVTVPHGPQIGIADPELTAVEEPTVEVLEATLVVVTLPVDVDPLVDATLPVDPLIDPDPVDPELDASTVLAPPCPPVPVDATSGVQDASAATDPLARRRRASSTRMTRDLTRPSARRGPEANDLVQARTRRASRRAPPRPGYAVSRGEFFFEPHVLPPTPWRHDARRHSRSGFSSLGAL